MHTKLISEEELREENRMTFFLKHSHLTIECYFCKPIIEIDCFFFTSHLMYQHTCAQRHSGWKTRAGWRFVPAIILGCTWHDSFTFYSARCYISLNPFGFIQFIQLSAGRVFGTGRPSLLPNTGQKLFSIQADQWDVPLLGDIDVSQVKRSWLTSESWEWWRAGSAAVPPPCRMSFWEVALRRRRRPCCHRPCLWKTDRNPCESLLFLLTLRCLHNVITFAHVNCTVIPGEFGLHAAQHK